MNAWRLAAASVCVLPLLAVAAEPPAPVVEGRPAAVEPPTSPPTRLQVYQRVMPRYEGRDLSADGGCVTVKFEIQYDGFVGDVVVLEAKPPSLAEPTVAAMKQWVFQSFPKSEARVHATQTFFFTPETMRMPAEAIRGAYGALGEGGALNSAGCGGTPARPAVADGKPAKPSGAKKK